MTPLALFVQTECLAPDRGVAVAVDGLAWLARMVKWVAA